MSLKARALSTYRPTVKPLSRESLSSYQQFEVFFAPVMLEVDKEKI